MNLTQVYRSEPKHYVMGSPNIFYNGKTAVERFRDETKPDFLRVASASRMWRVGDKIVRGLTIMDLLNNAVFVKLKANKLSLSRCELWIHRDHLVIKGGYSRSFDLTVAKPKTVYVFGMKAYPVN